MDAWVNWRPPALHAAPGRVMGVRVPPRLPVTDVPTFRLWASLPRFSGGCSRVRVPSSVPKVCGGVRGAGIPGLTFTQDFAGSSPVAATTQFGGVGQSGLSHLPRAQGTSQVRILPPPPCSLTGLQLGIIPTGLRVEPGSAHTGGCVSGREALLTNAESVNDV